MYIKVSEAIALLDIAVNIILVLGLAALIQKNQVNSRTLKDYFIKEVDKLNQGVAALLDELEKGGTRPKEIQGKFFNRMANTLSVTEIIDKRYRIDSEVLARNLRDLQDIIESDVNFSNNFRTNNRVRLSTNTLDDIGAFRSGKVKVFHEVIEKINDHTKLFPFW